MEKDHEQTQIIRTDYGIIWTLVCGEWMRSGITFMVN